MAKNDMKILVLGASGMIGHKMFQVLTRKGWDVYGSVQKDRAEYLGYGPQTQVFESSKIFDKVDLSSDENLLSLLNRVRPQVVINCVGITLRKEQIKDLNYCLTLNSFLPQKIRCWVEQNGAYLIHFSTDCVFSGEESPYSESSIPTALDIYGRTKYLGEVMGPHSLTLRGSMIGLELFGKTELLEWALACKGKAIRGFTNAIYSGVTTDFMAKLVDLVLQQKTLLTGVYQVSSDPICKFDLLAKINTAFQLKMTITPDGSYSSNKTLDSRKIQDLLKIKIPSWDHMIADLLGPSES
jgi:dTDP-4-dehydrorhamnose reductase